MIQDVGFRWIVIKKVCLDGVSVVLVRRVACSSAVSTEKWSGITTRRVGSWMVVGKVLDGDWERHIEDGASSSFRSAVSTACRFRANENAKSRDCLNQAVANARRLPAKDFVSVPSHFSLSQLYTTFQPRFNHVLATRHLLELLPTHTSVMFHSHRRYNHPTRTFFSPQERVIHPILTPPTERFTDDRDTYDWYVQIPPSAYIQPKLTPSGSPTSPYPPPLPTPRYTMPHPCRPSSPKPSHPPATTSNSPTKT